MRLNIKELLINLGVFWVALVLGLVLVESFLRAWNHSEKYNLAKYPKKLFTRESPSHLRPGFIGHFPKSEIHGRIEINSKGLRDLETSYDRKTKSLRVLVLGDSYVFGHGVEFEETYLRILERDLEKDVKGLLKKSIEIVKAGLPGTAPDVYLDFYNKEGYRYAPDILWVNIYLGNDIYDVQANAKNDALDRIAWWEQIDTSMVSYKGVAWLKVWLRQNFHLYSFVVDGLKSNPFVTKLLRQMDIAHGTPSPFVMDILQKEYPVWFKQKWHSFYDILDEFRSKNLRLIVSIIPIREQVNSDRLDQAIKKLGYLKKNIEVRKPNHLINRYCVTNRITCIDLLDELRSHYEKNKIPLHYDVDSHLNVEGNRVVASIFHKWFQGYLIDTLLTDT